MSPASVMPHGTSLVLIEVPPAFPDKEHGQEDIQEQAKALALLEGTMTEHVIIPPPLAALIMGLAIILIMANRLFCRRHKAI